MRRPHPQSAAGKLLSAYLTWLIQDCAPLKLRAIDQGAARSGRKPLGLTIVYVDLDLTLRIPKKQSLATYLAKPPKELAAIPARQEPAERKDRRVPVLLGVPGSGKSTLAAYLVIASKRRTPCQHGFW